MSHFLNKRLVFLVKTQTRFSINNKFNKFCLRYLNIWRATINLNLNQRNHNKIKSIERCV